MKRTRRLTIVVNSIAWLTSLFSICAGQGVAFDYVVVFFTSIILPWDIYLTAKACREKEKTEAPEDGSREH